MKEMEDHMQSHEFSGEISRLMSVSVAYVEKDLQPVVEDAGLSSDLETQETSKETEVAGPGTSDIESQETTKQIDWRKLWNQHNTLQLIDLCKQYDTEFQSGVKKYIWQKVARQISEQTKTLVTPQQCDTKWKGLKITYKQVKKHNETSGNTHRQWDYYNAIDDFLHKKPEIAAEATCSNRKGLAVREDSDNNDKKIATNDENESSCSESSTPTSSYKSSFSRKRRNCENPVDKRYKEKMERQELVFRINGKNDKGHGETRREMNNE